LFYNLVVIFIKVSTTGFIVFTIEIFRDNMFINWPYFGM